ncbi:uncharacterized protein BDZ99DRAFT_461084, partial [Mytilinidion resinicola]
MTRESWRPQHPNTSAVPGRSISDAIASVDPAMAERIGYLGARPPPPSGIEPDSSKKVYCTYWIRTGECDYMQQGCIYKHEMPGVAKLKELGFKEVPRWWKEKNAIIPGQGVLRPAIRDLSWIRRGGRSAGAGSDSSSDESDGAQNVRPRRPSTFATIPTIPTATLKAKSLELRKSPLLEDIPELTASPSSSQDDSSSSTTSSIPQMPPMSQNHREESQRPKPSSSLGDVDLLSLEDEHNQSLDETICLIPDKPPQQASGRLQQISDRYENHRASQRTASGESGVIESTVNSPARALKARVAHPSTSRAGRNVLTEAASPPKILPQERRERRFKMKEVPSTGLSTSKFAEAAQEAPKAKVTLAPNSLGGGQQAREHLTEAQRNAVRHQQITHRAPPEAADAPTGSMKRLSPPSNSGGRKKATPKTVTKKTTFVPATKFQTAALSTKL